LRFHDHRLTSFRNGAVLAACAWRWSIHRCPARSTTRRTPRRGVRASACAPPRRADTRVGAARRRSRELPRRTRSRPRTGRSPRRATACGTSSTSSLTPTLALTLRPNSNPSPNPSPSPNPIPNLAQATRSPPWVSAALRRRAWRASAARSPPPAWRPTAALPCDPAPRRALHRRGRLGRRHACSPIYSGLLPYVTCPAILGDLTCSPI